MFRDGIDRKYALVLLALAAVVLGIGIILRPARPEQPQPPSEREIARLFRLSEQRRLKDLSAYLSGAAHSAGDWLVSIHPGRYSGVLWDRGGSVITTGPDPDEPQQIVIPGNIRVSAARVPAAPGLPVAILRPDKPLSVPPVPRGRRIELGDWLLAVARNPGGDIVFAHGLYQGTAEARCGPNSYRVIQSSVPVSDALAGGGVFTLDGELEGFIAECDGRPVVISTSSVADLLRLPVSLNDELEQRYGFRVSEEGGAARNPASPAGLVTAVWQDSAARRAGLRPGDVLLGVGDQGVASEQDLATLAADPQTDHVLKIRRGGRVFTIHLAAGAKAPDFAMPSSQGIVLKAGSGGRAMVKSIVEDSGAARAGIEAGDTIVRVQGRATAGPAAAASALRRANKQSVLVELERNGKRLEVIVAP
ncbi:MAG: PDZ domain-containing protein [Bryobacterales bacterium]|nr:PDZ domain-containing protein [Bryobacterales bacterium]